MSGMATPREMPVDASRPRSTLGVQELNVRVVGVEYTAPAPVGPEPVGNGRRSSSDFITGMTPEGLVLDLLDPGRQFRAGCGQAEPPHRPRPGRPGSGLMPGADRLMLSPPRPGRKRGDQLALAAFNNVEER